MKSARTSSPPPEAPSTMLQPRPPEALQWEMQQVQLAVARRAYELFQVRNCEHGHDWEDWFQAESELLRPISVVISQSPECVSIRVNVLGFEADELQVAIGPTRIAIYGRKKLGTTAECGGLASADFFPDQVLRIIDVASEIDPKGAVVELQSGILKFELPRVVSLPLMSAAAA